MPPGFVKKAVPLFALLVAGIAVLAVGGKGSTTLIIGGALEGLAGILLMSLIFYEVGKSEDRERERERRGS
jgi:hypothetical protein